MFYFLRYSIFLKSILYDFDFAGYYLRLPCSILYHAKYLIYVIEIYNGLFDNERKECSSYSSFIEPHIKFLYNTVYGKISPAVILLMLHIAENIMKLIWISKGLYNMLSVNYGEQSIYHLFTVSSKYLVTKLAYGEFSDVTLLHKHNEIYMHYFDSV